MAVANTAVVAGATCAFVSSSLLSVEMPESGDQRGDVLRSLFLCAPIPALWTVLAKVRDFLVTSPSASRPCQYHEQVKFVVLLVLSNPAFKINTAKLIKERLRDWALQGLRGHSDRKGL